MSSKLKMAVSMLIFGTISIFVRFIPIGSSGIAFYRAAISVVGLSCYLLLRRKSFVKGINKRTFILLILSGAAMGFNWILLFEAYNYTTVATATLCYYFAPVIVTVLCPVIYKETLTLKQGVSFAVSTIGLVLITAVGKDQGASLRGILFGLGAAVLYATVMLLNKSIKGIDGILRTLWQFICAATVILPYTALTSGLSLNGIGLRGAISLVILGLVYTCITYVLYLTSVSELPGRVSAILGYIDPLTAVMVSVLFFGEPMLVTSIIGGVLILGATFVSELGSTKKI